MSSAPRKAYMFQLVKIQPRKSLTSNLEPISAAVEVTKQLKPGGGTQKWVVQISTAQLKKGEDQMTKQHISFRLDEKIVN